MTLVTGFPYSVRMNVTLTLDDELVKKVRKIAVDRDTTLAALIREYLERVAVDDAGDRTRRNLEELERCLDEVQLDMGERTWTREELHERS